MARVSVTITERDRGWKRLTALAEALQKRSAYAKVGVLDNGGLGSQMRGALTQAMIALVLEYGSQDKRIPARSFVGSTFERVRPELASMAAILVRKIYEGTMTVEPALGLLALKLSSEIKKSVTVGDEIPPPNAASTLNKKLGLTRKGAKGMARTLMDTGRMVASITFALVIGERN